MAARKRSRPDRKYLFVKIRVSPDQLDQIRRGARLSNPDDPPRPSTWVRQLALKTAARLEKGQSA